MKLSRFLSVIIFCLTMLAGNAQYNFDDFTKKLESTKKEMGGGATVMIYKDGKIIYKKDADPEFTNRTAVPIGASSQWLTAALVMTFVDEGKISLDDKVSQYLPIFKTYGKAFITIRHCLTNFTGIESPKGIGVFFDKKKFATLEDEVNSFANKHEIQTNPGTEFWYSNIGLNIAAHICETLVKNKGFDRLILERICRPLMMRNTSFYNNEQAVNPSGGANSSAADYINFLAMMLNKGMFNGKQVLSEKSVAAMQTIITTPGLIKYAPDAAKGFNYGMGTWIQEVDSQGNPSVIGSPSFAGTWPYVDKCRNYACIIMVKGLLGDAKEKVYTSFKNIIDGIIGGECK